MYRKGDDKVKEVGEFNYFKNKLKHIAFQFYLAPHPKKCI